MTSPLEVRSFRSVFALERRVYQIDSLRLNPTGIPLRGIVYAALLVAAALIAGALPPTSWLDFVAPWYVRDLGLPLVGAGLLGALRVEGRPFHLAALALISHRFSCRRLVGLAPLVARGDRWRPPALICIPDGSEGRFRSLRYRGPGAVLVHHPHLRAEWSGVRRADLTLHPLAGACARPTVLELSAEAVLEVRTR
ncbi:MAG: hypothetical protein ABR947_11470 [Solirubrobacteraceae bacterium]